MSRRLPPSRFNVLVFAGIVATTCSIYLRILEFGYLEFGDNQLVYGAPLVANPASPEAWREVLGSAVGGLWRPGAIAWHAMSVTFFGVNPPFEHAFSIALHGVNAVLLYAVLFRLTRFRMESALVAVVFAAHPIHAETVAWASARGELLGGTILLWALLLYAPRQVDGPARFRPLSYLLFAVGMTVTPMLYGAPLLLLVLDGWPLGRFSERGAGRMLIAEKLPLAVIACAALTISIATFPAGSTWQPTSGLVSLGEYFSRTFFPQNLAPVYPLTPTAVSVGGLAALAVFGGIAWVLRRGEPALLVGLSWFCALLAGPLALAMAGYEALSDRFAYAGIAGLVFAVVFAIGDRARTGSWQFSASWLAVFAVVVCGGASGRQALVWRNDIILFTHARAVLPIDERVESALAAGFRRHGYYDEATDAYRRAIALDPESPHHWLGLGTAFARTARWRWAREAYEAAALRLPDPATMASQIDAMRGAERLANSSISALDYWLAQNAADEFAVRELGDALTQAGEWDRARAHYTQYEVFYEADYNVKMAEAHAALGELDAALVQYDIALARDDVADSRYERARILYRLARVEESAQQMKMLARPPFDHIPAWLYCELVLGSSPWR